MEATDVAAIIDISPKEGTKPRELRDESSVKLH